MPMDYRKLKGRIIEIYGTQAAFSKEMGWSARTASLKLTGKVAWKQNEILLAKDLLDLQETDILIYFFTPEVQRI